MDPKTRQQALVLGGLLVVLAVVVARNVFPALGTATPVSPAPATSTASAPQRPTGAAAATPASSPGRRGGQVEETPVDLTNAPVRLDALAAEHPNPIPPERNPFRFGQARPAAGQGAPVRVINVADVPPAFVPPPVPAGPPPPPPIPYKYIGVVTTAPAGKVAVLSDGKGVYHGREGEVVEGQYRIVRISDESIQIEYADGRGRQTIRLSGS